MFLLLTLLFISMILYITQHYYYLIRRLFLMWKVPAPPSYPIVGNAHLFINKTSTEFVEIATYWAGRLGTYFKFWLGPQLIVCIQDPKDIEIVFSSRRHIGKPAEYQFMKSWLDDGLLLSTGKKWQDRRKIITPAFHLQMIENFTKTFDRLSNNVIDKLNGFDANSDIDLAHLIGLFALDVVCETAMGVSIDALSKPDSEYIKAVHDIAHVAHRSMMSFTIRFIPLVYRFSKLRKTELNALHILHGFADDVIRKRRQELMEHVNRNDNDGDDNDSEDGDINRHNELSIRKKRVLLDILLQSTIDGEPLSDLDIREEVSTFMFGGHDTIHSAFTFCMYNIAKNPEVQQKCFDEALNVFRSASTKEPVTLSLLNQLSYLELTIKESLRLFPPIALLGRQATEDIQLTNNRIIPKGTSIAIPVYTIGRNPDYFDEPEKFKPERFLEEEHSLNKRSPFCYLPFSAGPRNCPGQKFGLYELKCIISKIIRNFEISLVKDDEFDQLTLMSELVLQPARAIKFNLKQRVIE